VTTGYRCLTADCGRAVFAPSAMVYESGHRMIFAVQSRSVSIDHG
jgi:hypothetical protein